MGIEPHRGSSTDRSAELTFTYNGIPYNLVRAGPPFARSRRRGGASFADAIDRALESFAPDVLLTYGGAVADVRRQRKAKATGCRIVFGVFNTEYRTARFFDHVDAVLTPSQFISSLLLHRCAIQSTPIPTPLDPAETLATRRRPTFVTMINPSIGKGVMFFARLAEEICQKYPEIPLLVVESRGDANLLIQAGFSGGFDLRRHENLRIARSEAFPKRIFRRTRVLLVPSVAEEASGRVVAEALLNGIPPIVSDRGGLPENCGWGGFVLPLPEGLTVRTRTPVGKGAVTSWRDLVVRLMKDEAFYLAACRRAVAFSKRYDPRSVEAEYGAFFAGVASAKHVVRNADGDM
jgi:glycosyltransferase involved in cell wall biosynthesis